MTGCWLLLLSGGYRRKESVGQSPHRRKRNRGEIQFVVVEERCGRGKPNVDEELSTIRQGSGTSAGAAGLVWGLSPPCVCQRERFSLAWSLGRRKQGGHCCWCFYFSCRVSKQMTALSFQTLGLVLLCCSVIRGVIYSALNEIGLITKLWFFSPLF